MILNEKQLLRTNKIHIFLKDQSEEFLKIYKIICCEKCEGTGLLCSFNYIDNKKILKITSWDTMNFCEVCDGIGYIGFDNLTKINENQYICPFCKFGGCSNCNNGFVDWVTFLVRGT